MSKFCIFISYRRDDMPGYAGRLEDSLERALGKGRVFRDIHDIRAGDDFTTAIAERLKGAQAMLVLLGPRWAGPLESGKQRIDDPADFVRIEVAAALASSCHVLPVLLAGTNMPREADMPEPLRALTRRQALTLNDTSWDADMARIVGVLSDVAPPRREQQMLMVFGGILVVGVIAFVAPLFIKYSAVVPQPVPVAAQADPALALMGSWRATAVRYAWGDKYDETFDFKRHAGEVTGTATFLGYPRGIEDLKVEGDNIHFVTHTHETINNEAEHELTHHYSAERKGDVLMFRMLTTGGYTSSQPLEFTATKVIVP